MKKNWILIFILVISVGYSVFLKSEIKENIVDTIPEISNGNIQTVIYMGVMTHDFSEGLQRGSFVNIMFKSGSSYFVSYVDEFSVPSSDYVPTSSVRVDGLDKHKTRMMR